MKFRLRLFLILLLCLLACACAKNENQNKTPEPVNKTPVLEIVQDARGMWGIEGKTLFFRLFEDATAEFEYADEKKIVPRKINRAADVNSATKTKISADEFQQISDLLNSTDFQKSVEAYTRKCCCTDATLDYKIIVKHDGEQKNISLNNYCSLGEVMYPQPQQTADFPKSLAELIKIVDKTRRKYQPE